MVKPLAALVMMLAAHGSAYAPLADAHPLHTSYAELSYAKETGNITVSVRVFTDDFTSHIAGPVGMVGSQGGTPERRAAAYIARNLSIADGRGAPIPLRWCGWKRAGEMTAICLAGVAPARPANLRIRNTILMDMFADQLNILRSTRGTAKKTVLFTRKENTKTL